VSSASPKDYSQLRTLLLAQETFPLDYLHKFIGRKTPAFDRDVAALERNFPGLTQVASRPSADAAHIALTYSYRAPDVDSVIRLLQATDAVADLRMVL